MEWRCELIYLIFFLNLFKSERVSFYYLFLEIKNGKFHILGALNYEVQLVQRVRTCSYILVNIHLTIVYFANSFRFKVYKEKENISWKEYYGEYNLESKETNTRKWSFYN